MHAITAPRLIARMDHAYSRAAQLPMRAIMILLQVAMTVAALFLAALFLALVTTINRQVATMAVVFFRGVP